MGFSAMRLGFGCSTPLDASFPFANSPYIKLFQSIIEHFYNHSVMNYWVLSLFFFVFLIDKLICLFAQT